MDILIHILLIVIIGAFFFIDKYSTSFNPMFFVIILTILGFVFLQSSGLEYVDYSQLNKNSTLEWHPTTDLGGVGVGLFTVESFMVLVYWFLLILGSVNIILGKKDSNKRN